MLYAPLAVVSDAAVRIRMERAAAAAQIHLDFAAEAPPAGRWLRASAVLIDAALSEEIAGAALPRRERVAVLAGQPMSAGQWQASVAIGARDVLSLDDSDYRLVQLLAEATDEAPDRPPGRIYAVIGACGGAGSSVFAAGLAIAAAAEAHRAVLCDVDPDGAGLEVTLGMETAAGARWADISATEGRIPEGALRQALPPVPGTRGEVVLVGYGRSGVRAEPFATADPGAANAVLDATRRAGDIAVVDLPRRRTSTSDHVLGRADLTVLVVPAEVRGCYAAARLVPTLIDAGATVGLVVRGPSPGGLGAGDISTALSVPLIASMRPQPGLARSIESGAGLSRRLRGPLRRAALAVLHHQEPRI